MENVNLGGGPACLYFGSYLKLHALSHEPTALKRPRVIADTFIAQLIAPCEGGEV